MRLYEGVYYQLCGELLYLRNVNTGKDYLFNQTAFDILEFCKRNPEGNLEQLYKFIQQQYQMKDIEGLEEDIAEFLKLLEEQEILQSRAKLETKRKENIRAVAEDECLKIHQLFSASLEITYRCSERCIHCYVDTDNPDHNCPELSLEEYKRVLRELKDLGCIRLLVTGGEVCLKKDFIFIVDYAVALGMLVDVYTNGINMTDEQFDALCQMKLNSISFSLYSGEADVHDAITQVKGSFEKTLYRIMMFKCAGVETFIKSVVMRQNRQSLESLYKLGKRIGIPVLSSMMVIDGHSGKSANEYRLGSYELYYESMKIKYKYQDTRPQSGKRILDECVCMGGQTSLSIDPYGGVHPCVAFTESVGNIRQLALKEIWENSDFLNKLRTFQFCDIDEKCTHCQYANDCAICIGDSYMWDSGGIRPGTDTCMVAKAIHDATDASI